MDKIMFKIDVGLLIVSLVIFAYGVSTSVALMPAVANGIVIGLSGHSILTYRKAMV